ncbi:hypothetical protein BOX37_13320 [Nocardia mangyaensis]|uniref:Spheroidene monooxygenase n=1 Tax=Nocardia mangyaensis TaxID=2213200 RepID=A0A1J0VRX0_9NOCA|nr:hypothetical protein [Nocardia mangyaensis]APE34762.1 hypothetical protein BOX37_13320 [Nocardia mangyaensis]
MTVSFRLASYPARGWTGLLANLPRINQELCATPGLVAGRVFGTGNLQPPIGGAPIFRRWALFTMFESDSARDDFENSCAVDIFTDRSRELWQVAMAPTRIGRGEWRGWRPEVDPVPHTDDEPVVSFTYSHVRSRYVPTFLLNNKRVVDEQRTDAGLIAQLGVADDLTSTSTFSIWRSQHDLIDFAYRSSEAHKKVIKPSLTQWQFDNFSARFRIHSSAGTWDGRDPARLARLAAQERIRLAAQQQADPHRPAAEKV